MNSGYGYTGKTEHNGIIKVETITQLAQRHLKDKNHTTTDEEILNAKIELSNIERENKTSFYKIKRFIINS